MANNYVTIKSHQYKISVTLYEPETYTARRIRTGMTGKTYSEKSSITTRRWRYRLKVKYAGDATWGDLDNLKDAENDSYCAFTDPFGSSHNVYFEVPLVERPIITAAPDASTAEHLVDVQLRERLT